MANEKLLEKLNTQYNFEIESAFVYKGMSLWAKKENWPGVANFLEQQALEELSHAERIEHYLLDMDYDMTVTAVPAPKTDYKSVLEVFKACFEHEQQVTANFMEIMKDAKASNDYRTEIQVHWFLAEQVEEEASFKNIIAILERVQDSIAGLLQLDAQLAQRKHTASGTEA